MKRFIFLVTILTFSFNLKGQDELSQYTQEYIDSLTTSVIKLQEFEFEDEFADTSFVKPLEGLIGIKLFSETDLPSCKSLPCSNIPIEIDSLEISSYVSFYFDYSRETFEIPSRVIHAEITLVRDGRGIRTFEVKSPKVPIYIFKEDINENDKMRKGDAIVIEIKKVAIANSITNEVSRLKSYSPKYINIYIY